jgi:indolepyruvate decarboxylase
MTGSELSTAVRYRQAPVVLVLNNRGYSTEREIMEGSFNDIHDWRYERICDVIGGGQGLRVATHGEFTQALGKALGDPTQPYVINILLDPADRSPAMTRLARRLAKRLSTDRP